MADFIEWFNQVFISEMSIPLIGGYSINLLQITVFVVIFGAFLLLGTFLRQSLRRFLTRLQVREDRREQILWLIFLIVGLVGLTVALNVAGVNLLLSKRLFTYSIPIGQTRLSLTDLALGLAIVVMAIVFSKYLQTILRGKVLPAFQLPENAAFLLLRFIHLSLIALGVLVWANLVGFNMNGVLVALGGLSIGIGFGLQNIASNLASGVILIFERPIKIGDRVSVGDTLGIVTSINLRSTVVTTPEDIDIIVPNSKFISEAVTNMTHRNKRTRIKLPVGVSYKSDEDLVKEVLLEVAYSHPEILKDIDTDAPEVQVPFVRFIRFGDSSLDFELLAWIPDVMNRFEIISDLHFMIRKKFREHGIVVAYPQRDVHFFPATQ
ncbi:MAG: mechanosensitive ion channel [Candidatus Poribacteria bacterium]|nr:mechanosensitive ion channel [Candidatus Poribacteria bacterium]